MSPGKCGEYNEWTEGYAMRPIGPAGQRVLYCCFMTKEQENGTDAGPDAGAIPAETAPLLRNFDLAQTPTSPGCYLMRDEKDKVIYVGKAKNLRARIRTYLNDSDSRYTVKFLMRRVAGIECLVTSNEKEAILLENSLIKQYKPRYNVRLKDDKTYVSLKLNMAHEYPRLTVTRNIRKDGSRYFGPYPNSIAVRQTVKEFQRVFPLRLCSDSVLYNRARPCLYYEIKQCAAPCVNYISKDAYRDIVRQVELALEGRTGELQKLIMDRIKVHAEKQEFEEAAALRDRLYALRKTMERQRTVAADQEGDRDVFGAYTHGRFTEIQVVFFRGGRMLGGRSFSFKGMEMPLEEVLGSFLLQFYADAPIVPGEVLLPVELEEAEALGDVLSEQRGKKVSVLWPQRGEKRGLLELAARNAKNSFEEKRLAEQANTDLLEQVKDKLNLAQLPKRVECFDIATTQGEKSVGSMVVFEGGQPNKNRYRRFAIKHVEGQDDFAMMREVLLRRYKRAVEENDLPDLVLIDGGKGQLGVARTVLEDLGVENLDLAGIAKSRTLDGGGHSPERFFTYGRKNPIILPQHSPVVHFLARVRDEAHRFANTYHRKRRTKSALSTTLTEIPGVGSKRARLLLNTFGSLTRVREASPAAIAALPGFSPQLAETIKTHLAPRAGQQNEE
jgi:excinuclease ABC subunit C